MRPALTILLLIALILAAVAGWILVSGDDGQERVAVSVAVGPQDEGAQPAAGPGADVEPRPEAAPTEAFPDPASGNRVEALGGEEEDGDEEDGFDGIPVFEGRVVDAEGQPVQGARVLASHGRGQSRCTLDSAFYAESESYEVYDTITDGEGRFELQGPRPGRTRLAVRAQGYAPLDLTDQSLPAAPAHDFGDLSLDRGVTLEGRVVDPAGNPVVGASILSVTNPESRKYEPHPRLRGMPVALTGPDGSFRVDTLAAGAWSLYVTAYGHPDLIARGEAEHPGVEVKGLLFQLSRGRSIAGRIEGAELYVMEDLEVSADPIIEEQGGDPADWLHGRRVRPDEEGLFQLAGLKPGLSHRLVVHRLDETDKGQALSEPVTAGPGVSEVVLRMFAPAEIRFLVADLASGEPVTDFEVRLRTQVGRRNLDRVLEGREDGLFRGGPGEPHRVLWSADFPDRPSTVVTILAQGYHDSRVRKLEPEHGGDMDLGTILMKRTTDLRVLVVDGLSGEPVEEARVSVELRRPNNSDDRPVIVELGSSEEVVMRPRLSEKTDAQGRAELSALPGETSFVWATHGDYASSAHQEVFVSEEGGPDVKIELFRGGSVVVTVLDETGAPVPGAKVTRSDPSAELATGAMRTSPRAWRGGTRQTVADGDGRATFEHLVAGEHRFRAKRQGNQQAWSHATDGEKWAVVLLGEGDEVGVELVVPEVSWLAGTVLEAGRPVVGAELRLDSGDTVRTHLSGRYMGAVQTARTNGSGNFRFEGTAIGTHTVSVYHHTRAMPSYRVLEIPPEGLTEDVHLPTAGIQGRVLDERGRPLAGIEVDVRTSSSHRRTVRSNRLSGSFADSNKGKLLADVRTEIDGSYVLYGLVPDRQLIVQAGGVGLWQEATRSLRVEDGQVRTGIDLVLGAGGRLLVRAVDPAGAPVQGCFVSATLAPEDQEAAASGKGKKKAAKPMRIQRQAYTDKKGRATLEGLRPGTWRLNGFSRKTGKGNWTEPTRVRVQGGETAEAILDLP